MLTPEKNNSFCFCVSLLILGWGLSGKVVDIPSESPLEETDFPFPRKYPFHS